MTLRNTIGVIIELAERGAIQRYAITGAVAALNYIEPSLTEDLDILVSIGHFEERPSGLILLGPIEKALAEIGYRERTDVGYMIGDWPVQFLPVSSELDEEALEQAVEVEIGAPGEPSLTARCLSAHHLVAIAVKLGRLKDLSRVDAFLRHGAVDVAVLKEVLQRHGLIGAWLNFCTRAGIEDPLGST